MTPDVLHQRNGKKNFVCGNGFLAIHISNPIYLPVSILAGQAGGLGLVFGMTFLAGLFTVLLSRIVGRLRAILSVEVCGVAILMLGVALVQPAISRWLGVATGSATIDSKAVMVAGISPDMRNIARGLCADGLGVMAAGFCGTLGTGVSSSHIALAAATGATSRKIGLAAAVLAPIPNLLSLISAR